MVAEDFYGRWLESTPLERLRLKPAVEIDPGYTGLEQRGISMLLGILPEALRRDIVGARNVFTVSILYRLFVVYQPRGKGLPKSRTSKQDARGKMNLQNTMAQGDMNLCQILE